MHVFSSWKKKFKSFYHTPFVAAEKLFIFKLNLTGSLLKFSFLDNKNFYFDLNLKNFIFDAQTIAEFD